MTKQLVLAMWLVAALSPLAFAQPSSAAQAEALFKRGKELQSAGKLAEACAAFDGSQRLDPTVTTRLNQANCREKNGQLATAWGHFLEAERESRALGTADAKQLAKVATTRAAALEKRVSTLMISVAPDAAKIAGLEIKRGDDLVDPASFNAPLPIDGGTYTIAARAPGRRAWTQTVTIANEKDVKSIEVPVLPTDKPEPKPDPIDTKPDPVDTKPIDPKPIDTGTSPRDDRPTFSTLRGIAVGVGVIGLGTIAFGVVRGLSAKSKQSDAQTLCPDPMAPCDSADVATQLTIEGHDHATQANIGFAIGGGLVATAIVLWIVGRPSAPSPTDVSIVPVVDGETAGLTISGAW